MLEYLSGNSLSYNRLTEEDKTKRGILGRLVGVIADFKNPTRNGRKYSEELWDHVFSDPIMQEKIATKCVLGELGHPVDRSETDMEKVCVCLSEVPKKTSDGKLVGVFDILPTPNGRVLKTLLDYGTEIGVSSRGDGDTYVDYDGQESVEPNSYVCEGWDCVLLPAVKSARPKYVTESYHGKTLMEALDDHLKSSSGRDRIILEETISNIKNKVSSSQDDVNIKSAIYNDETGDSRSKLMEKLTNAVREKSEAERRVIALQEKLSACYAREVEKDETISQLKESIAKAQTGLKDKDSLLARITSLEEEIEKKSSRILEVSNSRKSLNEELIKNSTDLESINKQYTQKTKQVDALLNQVKTLTETLNQTNKTLSSDREKLTSEIADLKKDQILKQQEYQDSLKQQQSLTERYKKTAKIAVDKYIECQSIRIGVKPNEIKNRLAENYTFRDIDEVIESLQEYKLNVNKLPFSVSGKKPKLKINESKQPDPVLPKNSSDEVDDQLMRMVQNWN